LSVATIIGWVISRLVWASKIKDLKLQIDARTVDLSDCRRANIVVPAAFASAKVKADDLTIVEGIGPKINELLNKNGIYTFAQLADADPAVIKNYLEAAGPNYRIHDPGTWPAQSKLAGDGKWDELRTWQAELNKGK
jgi:predicted flap endonuclease-1-like 5' DNA nuclease